MNSDPTQRTKPGPAITPPRVQYCTRCVYPGVAATPLTFDAEGVCSGCRVHDEQATVDWKRRELLFRALIEEIQARKRGPYDCVIPVSGGKDSFYQVHMIRKVYGLRPLLVTYNENNETDVGKRNIQRMKEAFDVDYINITPSVNVLKRMNKVGFVKTGDPDLHAHMGIATVPNRIAVKLDIPLVVWGEHGFMNLGGMHSYKDMVEFTARMRKEHLCHGYDWDDFVGEEGLTEEDLEWFKYPSDDEIERAGLRGIFISNYFGWNQNEHTSLMQELYGFEINPGPFDRTYKRDSNLNNVHDNGVHDYMKFVKFGYGRATDHACRDIRSGAMTRDDGIEMVRQYDHVVPGDIGRWLEYVGMTRTEFDEITDHWRDSRVWVRNEYGQWIKDNIWEHN